MASDVTVQGIASVPARPDEVEVSLSVSYLDSSAHAALTTVAERSTALEALLTELGIEPHQWTTTGATVSEKTEWNRQTGEQVHRGYVATNRIAVRLQQPDVIGRLMNEATRRTQAHVAGPWWRVAPSNPAYDEAYRVAAQDARRRAEAYASALGARVGNVLAIKEPGIGVGPAPRDPGMRLMASAASAEPAEVNVHAGDLTISAAVIVTFALHHD